MSKWKKTVSPNTGETAWHKRESDESIVITFNDPEDPKYDAERKKAKMIIEHINELNSRG